MLPARVFTDDVFEDKEKPSGIVGKPKIIPELRKTLLCERVCGENADPANFQNFAPILQRIDEVVAPDTDAETDETDANSTDDGTAESPPEQA
jgi:hypothetical protein